MRQGTTNLHLKGEGYIRKMRLDAGDYLCIGFDYVLPEKKVLNATVKEVDTIYYYDHQSLVNPNKMESVFDYIDHIQYWDLFIVPESLVSECFFGENQKGVDSVVFKKWLIGLLLQNTPFMSYSLPIVRHKAKRYSFFTESDQILDGRKLFAETYPEHPNRFHISCLEGPPVKLSSINHYRIFGDYVYFSVINDRELSNQYLSHVAQRLQSNSDNTVFIGILNGSHLTGYNRWYWDSFEVREPQLWSCLTKGLIMMHKDLISQFSWADGGSVDISILLYIHQNRLPLSYIYEELPSKFLVEKGLGFFVTQAQMEGVRLGYYEQLIFEWATFMTTSISYEFTSFIKKLKERNFILQTEETYSESKDAFLELMTHCIVLGVVRGTQLWTKRH